MFISFEGIEGAGKTTQIKFMAEQLTSLGMSVLITREPGGTPIGEELRDVLLKQREESVVPMAELLLMFAARAQHMESVIQPALKQYDWILCDRFIDATYAYQGGGRGLPLEIIARLEDMVLKNFKPDCVLILDAPVNIGLERVKKRNGMKDRFEQEKKEFFERVRNIYKARAAADKSRYKIIDATQGVEEIKREIIDIIRELTNKAK